MVKQPKYIIGTGTVVVRLSDLNDNPPRLSRREWDISVYETDNTSPPDETPILEMTADDPDTSNYFLFRIVPGSGNGWQKFGLNTRGNVGAVFALSLLDYEDEKQRRGLRFLVEVTDRGPGGWEDRSHVDSAWVSVTLKDVNDNFPTFQRREVNVTIREDAPIGTLIETFSAQDPDEGENGSISYSLVDAFECLQIDTNGSIRIYKALDREGPAGTSGTIKVIAADEGDPPKTSTATLYISLEDVNDSPPRLLGPKAIHVQENLSPMKIGELFAADDDIWQLGHGPPFNMKISEQNSEFVIKRIELRFHPGLDNGNGGAEVWTKIPLDREECNRMTLKVTLWDAEGMTTTADVNIIVDDVNDNPMKPGSKTVFLWKTLVSSPEAPLGRVYVEDSDDWDGPDKTYQWADTSHPLFALDETTGEIFAMGQIREGRYDLFFNVSDSLWKQKNISARVTVIVQVLSPEDLTHAVPLTLAPTTATSLTQNWIPTKSGGRLGLLTSLIEKTLSQVLSEVKVVSVYDVNSENVNSGNKQFSEEKLPTHNIFSVKPKIVGNYKTTNGILKQMKFYPKKDRHQNYNIKESKNPSNHYNIYNDEFDSPIVMPSACVWISAQDKKGSYMDVVKLTGFLELNIQKIEEKMNLTIHIGMLEEMTGSIMEKRPLFPIPFTSSTQSPSHTSLSYAPSPSPSSLATTNPSAAASLASTTLKLQVVDGNTTALVTPRLSLLRKCTSPSTLSAGHSTVSCQQFSCLNGGRCIPTEKGSRCVCPGYTEGPFCFTVSRSFSNDSWIWLNPLPSCFPIEFSLRFLTRYPNGILLYSGPLSNSSSFRDRRKHSPLILILQLADGRPQLIVEKSGVVLQMEIKVENSVNNEEWHDIHVQINKEGAIMMLDFCASRDDDSINKFKNCISYAPWPKPMNGQFWGSSSPLQLGGLANKPPRDHRNEELFYKIIDQSLRGCISELRIVGKLIDLGEPKYSHKSLPGCFTQERACTSLQHACDGKSFCSGGLGSGTYCSCPMGWTGVHCKEHTEPVTIGTKSFIKLALSFTPDPLRLKFNIRLKTKLNNGPIFKLSSQDNYSSLVLKVNNGIPCLIYKSRSPAEKKTSTVSIIGITSTSSVKTLNISNTFYIKNWNKYGIEDKLSSSKTQENNKFVHKSPVNDMISSTISVCLSGQVISDGTWYEVKGGRFGYNLALELSAENVQLRNETLRTLQIYKSKFHDKLKKKFKKRDPPNAFIIDVRDGLTIGNSLSLPDNQQQENTIIDPITCIDDFRLSGHQLPLPPKKNESRWAQMAAFRGVQNGCSVKSKCQPDSCPPNLTCKENFAESSCGCSPHHRISQHGCRPFDVCIFSPCLNGGFCEKNSTGFTCACLPRFDGQHCQWKASTDRNGGLLGHMLISSSIALLFLLVAVLVFSCHLFRRKKRTKMKREAGEGSFTTDAEAGNKYITIELKSVSAETKTNVKNKEDRRKDTLDCEERVKKEERKNKDKDLPQKVEERLAVLLPRDDLRAYAYEGEGSSDGSLGSAISDLRRDINTETEETCKLPPILGEVVDLLRNLPDASLHYKRPNDKEAGESDKIFRQEKGSRSEKRRNNNSPFKEDNGTNYSKAEAPAAVGITRTTANGTNSNKEASALRFDERSKHSFIRKSSSSSFWYSANKAEQYSPDVSIVSCSPNSKEVLTSSNSGKTLERHRPDSSFPDRTGAVNLSQIPKSGRAKKKKKVEKNNDLNSSETGILHVNVLSHMSVHV